MSSWKVCAIQFRTNSNRPAIGVLLDRHFPKARSTGAFTDVTCIRSPKTFWSLPSADPISRLGAPRIAHRIQFRTSFHWAARAANRCFAARTSLLALPPAEPPAENPLFDDRPTRPVKAENLLSRYVETASNYPAISLSWRRTEPTFGCIM